jgi:hypothetical protein
MIIDTSNWIGSFLPALWLGSWLTVFFVWFRFRKHRSILASIFFSIILTLVVFWISVDVCDIASASELSRTFLNRVLSIYLWGLVLVAPYLILAEWAVRAFLKKRKAVTTNDTDCAAWGYAAYNGRGRAAARPYLRFRSEWGRA